MRVAMFEGFGAVGEPTSDPRVEKLIRDQVSILQGVQATLWDAYGQWRNGKFLVSVAIPASILLSIGRYDYRYSVDSWQASVDTWWKTEMTDAVRAAPYERGADGVTRIDAWTKMGKGLIEWAQRIAREMQDDGAFKVFSDFMATFTRVVREAISGGVKLALDLFPSWVKWGAVGLGALYLLSFFPKRRT